MSAYAEKVAAAPMEGRVPRIAIHIILLVIPTWVGYLYFNGELFGYHATFMSLGYMLAMAEGVWLASRAVIMPPGDERLTLLKLHMYVQITALLCISIGFYSIYLNKSLHGKPHFTTYHSWSGLAVLFATFAVAALGTLGFRYLGLIHVLPDHMHASLKAWHRKAGAFTFFGSVFVVMLGLSTQGIHKGWITYTIMFLCSLAGGLIFNIHQSKEEETFNQLFHSTRAP